jgi:hypothetical protein
LKVENYFWIALRSAALVFRHWQARSNLRSAAFVMASEGIQEFKNSKIQSLNPRRQAKEKSGNAIAAQRWAFTVC